MVNNTFKDRTGTFFLDINSYKLPIIFYCYIKLKTELNSLMIFLTNYFHTNLTANRARWCQYFIALWRQKWGLKWKKWLTNGNGKGVYPRLWTAKCLIQTTRRKWLLLIVSTYHIAYKKLKRSSHFIKHWLILYLIKKIN